jgi:uncharacterized protein (DUF1697 family)
VTDAATRFVGFVRAVMVGREGLHRDVLIEAFEGAGATAVRSHLATGNVSFHADQADVDTVRLGAEAALGALLGRTTPVFVRSQAELEALVASDPFRTQPYERPRDLAVLFFAGDVPATLEVPFDHTDATTVFGKSRREVFIATTDRPDGRHPGSPMGVVERQTGELVTARAWSTVLRVTTP